MNFFSKLKKILFEFRIIGSLTSFITIMPSVGSTLLLTSMYSYSPWLQTHQEIGVLIFVLIMTFFCGLALLAINLLGIVSGFAFGFQIGCFAYLFGILGASTLMFILARRFASNNLQDVIENKPRLRIIKESLISESGWRAFFVLILMRLSPVFPFAATNFVVSASGISYRVFTTATIIGMLPRISAFVFVGSSISELSFQNTQETWLLVIGILATITAVVVIGIISRKALKSFSLQNNNFSNEKLSKQLPIND